MPNFSKKKFESIRSKIIKFEVEFKAIIIVSRGLISNFTIHNLSHIIRKQTENNNHHRDKRLIIAAFKENMDIWIKTKPHDLR
jgi:hypothetical protein